MIERLGRLGKKIIFVRHGESIGNAIGLDDKSLSDTANHRFDLTQLGREQARNAAKELEMRGLVWDRAFYSSYYRTKATWQEINSVYPCCAAKPNMDARLDEWWRGIWHTMSKEDIARLYPLEEKIKQREGWYNYRAPGGQSGPDVELQIRSFLSDFMFGCYRDVPNILIVGHGKWAILFWRIIMGASVDEAEHRMKISPFGNCSIAIFEGRSFTKIN